MSRRCSVVSLAAVALLVLCLPQTSQAQCTNIIVRGPGVDLNHIPCYNVAVTPDGTVTPTRATNGSGFTAAFTVKNTGFNSDIYTFTCQGTLGVTCSSFTPTSKTLASNATVTVTATYATGGTPQTGRLQLTATSINSSDIGYFSVPIVAFAVAVTPDGAVDTSRTTNTSGYSRKFAVKNTGSSGSNTYTLTCSGSASPVVTCGTPSPSSLTLAAGATDSTSVTYGVGAVGTGTVTLTATGTSATDNGSYSIPIVAAAVAVTPDNGTAGPWVVNTTGNTTAFTVKNTGTARNTYTLSCGGSGGVSCTNVNPASTTLDPNATSIATGTYTMGSTPGKGLATVTATGGASDGGSDTVTIIPVTPVAPALTLVGPGRDSIMARELCLTVKVGSSAAYECGDLRLTHALPPTRTVNVARTPVLVYSSQQAHPFPLVGVNVGLPSSATQPDSVIATLTIGGVQRARQKWLGSQWTPGRASRIAVGYDASADTTGRYPYALQVTNYYGTSPFSTSLNDALLIVNRAGSPFGPGWWLAGLEQLRIGSTIEWVGGNGDIKVYRSAGTNVWVAPATSRPDTLKLVNASFYARLLAGGDTVKFDLAGNHIATIRPLNWQTSFNYSSGLLSSIAIPPASAGLSYTFSYTSGALTGVTAPGARTTTIGRTSGVVTSIRDPGDSAVGFVYAVPSSKLITSRTNRVGVSDAYTYDAAQRLQSVQVGNFTGHTGAIVTGFTSLESLGFATTVDTSSAETVMDGPRQDSVDVTHFRLDRYGNPWRVVDAHGGTTLVTRADSRFPALATRLQDPTGVVTLASYDAWGNVLTVTDSMLQVGGQPSITRYEWDSKWQAVTKVAPPEGDSVLIAYDPTTGNRISQQDARGTTSQVQYRYYTTGAATGLLRAVRSPLGAADSLVYDNLNNVSQTQAPLGRWSMFWKDGIGRDTLARTPVDTTFPGFPGTDSVITAYHWQRTLYDAVGRVNQTLAWAASLKPNDPLGVGTDTLHVQTTYDAESRPITVDHWATPDRAAVSHVVTQWGYNYEGRRVFEQAADGLRDSTQYDGAGNPVRQYTRRGHVIQLTYDALNRVVRRVTPAATYAGFTVPFIKDSTGLSWSFPNYPNDGGTGFVLAADTAVFTYDVAGRMLTANNGDARVTRTYGTDGRLSTETQAVRTVTGSDFSQHVYTSQFGYDRDGRRAWLKLPAALAAGAGKDTIRYSYANTGQLGSVRDPLGNSFQYLYDLENKVDSLVLPGGLFEKRFYDAEGRMTRRRAGTATVTWHDDAQVVNAAGKVLRAVTLVDSMTYAYSPMGPLIDQRTQSRSDATYHMEEDWVSDVTPYRASSDVGGVLGIDTLGDSRFMIYQSGTARLQSHLKIIPPGGMHWTVEGFTYDASGNQLRDSTRLYQVPSDFTSNLGAHELVSYYDAAQQLRAVDRRGCITWGDAFPTHPTGKCMPQFTLDSSLVPSWQGLPSVPAYIHRYTAPSQVSEAAFEEYRYDALGRRVWRRSHAKPLQCLDTSCHDILVRYVSDGSAILGEFQVPGGDTSGGVWEQDAGQVGPMSGRVVYIHGLEMDKPLAVVRMDESTQHPAYMLQLHRDIRGTVDSWTPDATVCSTPCFNTSGVPGLVGGLKATQRHTNFGPPSPWYGSLVYDAQDASGYLYRRNRYVDYASGRFTQEDPIGLAGGLNSYGFANGDVVTYADPLGLDGCTIEDFSDCKFLEIQGSVGLLPASAKFGFGPFARLAATLGPTAAVFGSLTVGNDGVHVDGGMRFGIAAEGELKTGMIDASGSMGCSATTNESGGCTAEGALKYGNAELSSNGDVGVSASAGPAEVDAHITVSEYLTFLVGSLRQAITEFIATLKYVSGIVPADQK